MRVLATSAVILLSLRLCEGSEHHEASPTAEASARAEASAKADAGAKAEVTTQLVPQIGGNIVTVGDYAVEILLSHDGRIWVRATTQDGMLVMDPRTDRVAVTATGKGGVKRKVRLAWFKPRACFAAQADTRLAPGPVEIELTMKGTTARAKLEGLAIAYEPVIGGSVLVAGTHGVELAVGMDGEVEAVLRDVAGAELGADAHASLEVDLAAEGKTPHVKLAWDESRASLVGRVDAGVKVAPGPVQVKLGLDGKTAIGGLSKFVLKTTATHGGRVLVAGDFAVELVAKADGTIQAFVYDTRGKAYAQGDLDLSLAVEGAPSVKFEWDAPSLSYRAKLDAGLDLSAKPLTLTVKACCGRFGVGGVAGLSADARLRAKGNVDANAKLGTDTNARASGNATAASGAAAGADAKAKASLTVPKPNVRAQAPSVTAKTSTKSGGGQVSGKAGFSFGTKK